MTFLTYLAKRNSGMQKKLLCEANLAKLCSFSTVPKFKYGYEIPHNYKHAMELDKHNGNTKRADATKLEMELMHRFNVFVDKGLNTPVPDGYKKVKVHLIYDVKHDGRHHAKLVADGHLTELPTESVYSGVVSFRGLCMFVFVAEHNGLVAWSTDIPSAYLKALTKEHVCIIAGPEYGP